MNASATTAVRVKPDVVPLEAIPGEEDQEDRGEDVGQRERARELPLELVERDREDREEEEPLEHRLGEDAFPRWSDS